MSSFDPRGPGEGNFGRILGRSAIPEGTEDRIVERALKRVQARRRRVFALRVGGVALAACVAGAVAVLWLIGAFKLEPATPGPRIAKLPAPPPVIWTATDRTVQHSIGPHQVTLSADTRVKIIGKSPDNARLELLGGEARFAVQPLQVRSSFVVLTPHVKVLVVGTRFYVDSDEPCSRVEVAEGQVRAISLATRREYLLGPGMSRTFCRGPGRRLDAR
jgi:ferric-dicitrate binding protein FerR (iron transport regulator)